MNLTLEDVNISVTSDNDIYVGAVAGYSDGATIEDCTVRGSISVDSQNDVYVGGIVGDAYDSSLTNCINYASVSGSSSNGAVYVGGIVGGAYSSLTNCTNYASVNGNSSGTAKVGGIAGETHYDSLTNCINYASVNGNSSGGFAYVGGVAGSAVQSSLKNCINSANVSGSGKDDPIYYDLYSSIGGIAGYSGGSDFTNCGYLKNADVNTYVWRIPAHSGLTEVNVGTFADADEVDNIVFELTPLIDGEEFDENTIYSKAANGEMIISFKAWPGEYANAYSNGGVNIQASSDNEELASADISNTDGTITVTGQGITGNVAIDVTATLYTYEFSDEDDETTFGKNGSYNRNSELTTETYQVNVNLVAAETPDDEETGGGSSGGGGCNAGTGALALLALIPLALRKKR